MTMEGLVDDILHRQQNNDNRRQNKLNGQRQLTSRKSLVPRFFQSDHPKEDHFQRNIAEA